MAGEGGGYPGLPNWGYGLHLQPNDLLQFIKGTPAWKEVQQRQGLSDAQIAHLAAQTGLTGVQTQGAQQDITQKAELFPLQKEHTQSQIGTERAKLGSEVLGQAKTRQEMEWFPQTAQALIGERGAMGDYYKAHAGALTEKPDQVKAQRLMELIKSRQSMIPTYETVIDPKTGKPTPRAVPDTVLINALREYEKLLGMSLMPVEAPGGGGGAPPVDPAAREALLKAMQNGGKPQMPPLENAMWQGFKGGAMDQLLANAKPLLAALSPSLALALEQGGQSSVPQPATPAPQAAPAPKAQPKPKSSPARTPAQMTPAELQERYQLSPLMRYLDRLLYAGGLANRLPGDATR